jgi:hypothetical protein
MRAIPSTVQRCSSAPASLSEKLPGCFVPSGALARQKGQGRARCRRPPFQITSTNSGLLRAPPSPVAYSGIRQWLASTVAAEGASALLGKGLDSRHVRLWRAARIRATCLCAQGAAPCRAASWPVADGELRKVEPLDGAGRGPLARAAARRAQVLRERRARLSPHRAARRGAGRRVRRCPASSTQLVRKSSGVQVLLLRACSRFDSAPAPRRWQRRRHRPRDHRAPPPRMAFPTQSSSGR